MNVLPPPPNSPSPHPLTVHPLLHEPSRSGPCPPPLQTRAPSPFPRPLPLPKFKHLPPHLLLDTPLRPPDPCRILSHCLLTCFWNLLSSCGLLRLNLGVIRSSSTLNSSGDRWTACGLWGGGVGGGSRCGVGQRSVGAIRSLSTLDSSADRWTA